MNKGLILSIISGLTTLSGMLFTIDFKDKEKIDKITTISLSMAFIVMILVSIFDLFIESLNILKNKPFLGILGYIMINYTIIYIILKIKPKNKEKLVEKGELYFLGIFNMVALLLHNIPEGVITYITTNYNFNLGIKITTSIIMHNIPEGISIAVPIYYATKSRKKAFIYTFIAAIGEPIGSIIPLLLFKNLVGGVYIGFILITVAILMINISIYKIFPKIKTNKIKDIFIGLIIGFILFLINIILT